MPRTVRQRWLLRFITKIAALWVVAFASFGCSHAVLVRTAPEGAMVSVDGEAKGESPLVVETRSGVFDTMSVTAELEGFSSKRVLIEQTEWFLWPGLLAVTPFLALPLVFMIPVGTIVAVVWAVVTSPTLLSLAFIRTYPDEVLIELEPRQAEESLEFLPTDWWTTPEEYAPNPLPTMPEPQRDDAPVTPPTEERDDASPPPG